MADKYYLVSHEVNVDQYALYSSVARPGLATNKDDPVSRFDQQIENIRADAEAISGISPIFVSFKTKSHNMGDTIFHWCLFNDQSALAFAMMVGGKVTEHDWPEPMGGLSEEEILVKFFEVVATQFW